jgi:hypothetical protein
LNGKNFLAIHGHLFDYYCMNKTLLSSLAGGIYRTFRRIDLLFDRDIFHRLCFENEAWKLSSDIVTDGALEYGKNREADLIFSVALIGRSMCAKTALNISTQTAGTTGIAIMS